ncbi:MAG: HAD hydrolase-like protein, partial [Cytophagales bacterium]
EQCDHILDDMFYSPYHPDYTQSISRKPDTLMFERAISKYNIDISNSWMVGDSDRDIISAEKLGIKGLRVNKPWEKNERHFSNLSEAVETILK